MSPEIRMNEVLVADVPDETGIHQMLDGSPLYVDVSSIDARNSNSQIIILEGSAISGRRVVKLTSQGIGDTESNTRRIKGDKQQPHLYVTLKDRPIRISYTRSDWNGRRYKQAHYNLGWMRR